MLLPLEELACCNKFDQCGVKPCCHPDPFAFRSQFKVRFEKALHGSDNLTSTTTAVVNNLQREVQLDCRYCPNREENKDCDGMYEKPKLVRESVRGVRGCFTVAGLLSPGEAKVLVGRAEQMGFGNIAHEPRSDCPSPPLPLLCLFLSVSISLFLSSLSLLSLSISLSFSLSLSLSTLSLSLSLSLSFFSLSLNNEQIFNTMYTCI